LPDIPLQEKKTVLELLESFKGTGPLRELLAQLNYDPLNEPVSRKDWPEPAQTALAQDPRIYGQAAGDFYVIYAQLTANKLKLTDERTVIPQLLKEYPYALFIFSDKSQTEFHFVNVKWENNQKRRLYRRIAVGPQERLRTAVERISLLDIQTIEAGLLGITAQQIQDRHDEAFDVAKVSKSFFDEYKRVFEVMRDAVKGFGPSEEEQDRRHLFTQRLFNRLMFLRFIQKKGWLTIDGSTDYLAALWASHGKLKQDGKNFYTDRLRLLFAALNNERAGIVLQGGGGTVEATIGKVKYLNGGLFEETDEDKDSKVRIADTPFKEVFDKANGLFEAFNFTITESTPLDIEIAVDPEMLGKIFEELVTGRHDSGSYYTPKPIVSFMCREALKGYLATQAPDEQKAAIERFVDKHEPDMIRNAEDVLNALRRVTVCDPACGSGAYLLGMMHELLDLRRCLFQTRQIDNKTIYQRKLDIIQTNIYGVDLAEFAVNIARLRLWLSLAVDYDGPEPQPLPNLDYKIEIGDSLLGPNPANGLEAGFRKPLIDKFLELKKQFLTSHHSTKKMIKEEIQSVRADIASFSSNATNAAFDWNVEFAEIFVDGGFDIVVGNPPYGIEFSAAAKTMLKERHDLISDRIRNSFLFFTGLAISILKPNRGMLSFVLPNEFLFQIYMGKARHHFLVNAQFTFALNLGESVFEAVVPACVIGLSNAVALSDYEINVADLRHCTLREIEEKLSIRDFGKSSRDLVLSTPNFMFSFDMLRARLVQRLATMFPSLDTFCTDVANGISTSCDQLYLVSTEQIQQNGFESKYLRQSIRGGQFNRFFCPSHTGEYVLYVDSVVESTSGKNVLHYLKQHKTQLIEKCVEKRKGSRNWQVLFRSRSPELFRSPKIMVRQTADRIVAAADVSTGFYCIDSVNVIQLKEEFIDELLFFVGLLNSKVHNFFYREISQEAGRVLAQVKPQRIKALPICMGSPEAHKAVIALTQNIMMAKGINIDADVSVSEGRLNEIVYEIYSLSTQDIQLVVSGSK
jgi:hypothetical protein